MIINIIEVIAVERTIFFKIFGFSGAPGSTPSILSFFSLFTSIGSIAKKTIHHKHTKTTKEPVMLNYILTKLIFVRGLFPVFSLVNLRHVVFNASIRLVSCFLLFKENDRVVFSISSSNS